MFTTLADVSVIWFSCYATLIAPFAVHSGCAISGLVWLIVFTVQATRELLNKQKVLQFVPKMFEKLLIWSQTSAPTVAITYFILMLLLGIVLFAYPKARTSHHDAFERTHRFLGWTTTALVWCQVCDTRTDFTE